MESDRQRFERNPALRQFTRPAVPGEMPGVRFAPGTVCTVKRLASGIRQRIFTEQASRMAASKLPVGKRRAWKKTGRK